MKDTRQFKRVEKKYLASYEILSGDETRDRGLALEVNLSLDGLHLEIPTLPKVGDALKVILAVKDSMVTVIGKVVWVTPGEDLNAVGCHLSKIEKSYKDIFKAWLKTT